MAEYDISKNAEYASVIKEKLGLDSEVVAIKFFDDENEIPANIEKLAEPTRHCQMVKYAADGKAFYATKDEEACKGGSSAIGLEDAPKKVSSGEKYFELGRFKSIEESKELYEALPKLDVRHKGVIYCPLKDAEFEPDVIIYFAKPLAGMRTAQALVYNNAERVNPNFSGIQSVCGDVCAGPIINKKPNMSLGCDGSRKAAKVKPEELVVGINKEEIEPTVAALNKIL